LKSVLCFDGTPISARNIRKQIKQQLPGSNVTPFQRRFRRARGGAA